MEKQSFWDRYARRYSHFVRADQEAYAQMLEWIRPAVRDRTVLELATGTGVIAHGIVHEAASIEATDASARDDRRGTKPFPLPQAALFCSGHALSALCRRQLRGRHRCQCAPPAAGARQGARRGCARARTGWSAHRTDVYACGGGQACKAAPLADAPCRGSRCAGSGRLRSFCSSCADTAGRSCSTMCCRALSR